MVGTRGVNTKADEVLGATTVREKRKASRGSLEEPQDEIFWDSDEAKSAVPVKSRQKPSSTATSTPPKVKGSPGKEDDFKADDCSGSSSQPRRMSDEQTSSPASESSNAKAKSPQGTGSPPAPQPKKSKGGVSVGSSTPKPTKVVVSRVVGLRGAGPNKKNSNAVAKTGRSRSLPGVSPAKGRVRLKENGAGPGRRSAGASVIGRKKAATGAVNNSVVESKETYEEQHEPQAIKRKTPQKKITKKELIEREYIEEEHENERIEAASVNAEQAVEGEGNKKKREPKAPLLADTTEPDEEDHAQENEDDEQNSDKMPNEEENGTDEEDNEMFQKSSISLRRSTRRNSPTWLVGPHKLKGYPSPSQKNSTRNSRIEDDSEDISDGLIYPVRGRFGRCCRRPKKYQEDTEEEEDISRGKGKPRGIKGSLKRRHSSVSRDEKIPHKVGRPRRKHSLSMLGEGVSDSMPTPRARRRLPRVTYRDTDSEGEEYSGVGSRRRGYARAIRAAASVAAAEQAKQIEDEEMEEEAIEHSEENEAEIEQEAEEDEGGEEQEEEPEDVKVGDVKNIKKSPKSPVTFKRNKRKVSAILSDDEDEEKSEDDSDDERGMNSGGRKAGKLLDPILRSEDCLEYAKSIDSCNGKKRTRRPVKRLSYSTDARAQSLKDSSSEDSSSHSSGDEDKGYSLRRRNRQPFQHGRSMRRRNSRVPTFLDSPARKPVVNYKRRTTHNKSSTSNSSTDTDDERTFEKRRAKSNAKARGQMMPVNLSEKDMQNFIIKDRMKVGSSLADVEPMAVDRDITFTSIGGLSEQLKSLKEMVVLPLLYPEIFQKFSLTPPRGVLFHGPPGTGKTLVARALANECSVGQKKVAFFMRKGADCLSKWVGESERQLRLLFDQAYQMRPSIIFFDEIDGLAPVRSSRQDQIHSSIVSTLLALMDGLDSRGEIIIIGATNRIEAIDPALRRPGRFDRELSFPLPSAQARRQILSLHTSCWSNKPRVKHLQYLALNTPGYCGADLKSLCCEAVLSSLRHKYPQVYESSVRLRLDVSSLNVKLWHFKEALRRIVPAGQRVRASAGRKLPLEVRPLLQGVLNNVLEVLSQSFPQGLEPMDSQGHRIVHSTVCYRPRLLLVATKGQGDTSHLAPAVIHAMEKVPVHRLDLSALYANTCSRTPEEAVAQVFHEACSRPPSIIYLPSIDRWFECCSDSVKQTLLTLLDEMNSNTPVLLLATSHTPLQELEAELAGLFSTYRAEVFTVTNPTKEERQQYFKPLFYTHLIKYRRPGIKKRTPQPLPVDEMQSPRTFSEKELQRLVEIEEATLCELRIFLRQICAKLARNRQFYAFSQPVDVEATPDYLDIIKEPMDLETMMTKIDKHNYTCAQDFLKDIDLICHNALEYNPNHSPHDQHIRHAACALRDTAYTLIKTEMDTDFEDKCRTIREDRKKRNAPVSSMVPEFVYTQPLPPLNGINHCNDNSSSNGGGSNEGGSNGSSSATKTNGFPGRPVGLRRKRKRSSWSRGLIQKPKKKANIEKTTQKKNEEFGGEEDDEGKNNATEGEDEIDEDKSNAYQELEESVESVDSTSTLDVTSTMRRAAELCTEHLSTEDSSSGEHLQPVLQSASIASSSSASSVNGTVTAAPAVSSSGDNTGGAANAAAGAKESTSITLDWSHLDAAYSNCVTATEGCTLSQLQMLYAAIMRLARLHATRPNKTLLLQETEDEIRRFAQYKDDL